LPIVIAIVAEVAVIPLLGILARRDARPLDGSF
jgi:hypothetical protein